MAPAAVTSESHAPPSRDPTAHPLLRYARPLVAATAGAAVATSLRNGFAYDDVPIIVDDRRLHALHHLAAVLQRSYWPTEDAGLLWRPLTLAGFTLQWVAGDGAAWVFHLVNLLLAMLVAVLAHQLYQRLLPPLRALGAAVLFASLPVHTEVTANLVGQAELWCTLFVLVAALAWLDDAGADSRRQCVLGFATLAAIMSKEQGLMMPALLFALEWARPTGRRPWPRLRRDLLLTAGVASGALLARTLVLEGLGGGDPAPALAALGPGQRALVMLALVPRILGTLLWPVRLLADYNPGDVATPQTFTSDVAGGAVVVGLILLLCSAGHARRRTLALLVVGMAAFLPVSNLLFASGVVFAERHLFLPSVALVAMPFLGCATLRGRLVIATEALIAVAVVLGVLRSSERNRDWQDTPTLVASIVRDAPRNYRGLTLWATEQVHAGRPDSAEALLRVALGQFAGDAKVHEELGQLVRVRAGCGAALAFFQRALELQPGRATAQARATACSRERAPEVPRTPITIVRPSASPRDSGDTLPQPAARAAGDSAVPAPTDSVPARSSPFAGVPRP